MNVKQNKSFELWRHQPENIGKDWRIHRDLLREQFILLCNKHESEIIVIRNKNRKLLLQKLIDEWKNCNNEVEMLKIIMQIAYHCFEVKNRNFYLEIKELLRVI